VRELRAALETMGSHPTEEEVFVMIHDVISLAAIVICNMQAIFNLSGRCRWMRTTAEKLSFQSSAE
jgi:hypothetical protein